MFVLINNQKYSFKSGYNTHKPSENGWKKQNQDAFKMCKFGEYQVFVKRFEKETQNIPGYQFLVKTKGRRLPSLPMIYDVVTISENGKNVTYLFQEALQGNTLEEVMHQNTFKFNALHFAKNLYDALQSITNEGFWYTDFVEKNIFVANNGQCYLIDLDSVVPLSILPNEDSPLISQVNKNYKIAVSTYWYRDTFNYPFTYIKHNLRGDTINYLELFVFIAQIRYYIDNNCSVNFTEAKTRKAIPEYLLNLDNAKTYDVFKSCFLDSSNVQNILSYDKLEEYIKEVLFPENKTYEIDFHNSRLLSGGTIPKPKPNPKPKPTPQPEKEPDDNPKKSNIWLWLGGVAAAIGISLFVANQGGGEYPDPVNPAAEEVEYVEKKVVEENTEDRYCIQAKKYFTEDQLSNGELDTIRQWMMEYKNSNPNFNYQNYRKTYVLESKYESKKDFYNISNTMIQNDPLLIKLILESRSLKTEMQSWFDLYSKMNDVQIEKLYDILTREKNKLTEIEKEYTGKKLKIASKQLDNNHNYDLLYEINDLLNNNIGKSWYSLLSNNFQRGENLAYNHRNEYNGRELYINEFNLALAYMLNGEYEESYYLYVYLLKDELEVKECREIFPASVQDIEFFISHSNYKFDRKFANLIYALHHYFGKDIIGDTDYNYPDGVDCFMSSYDKDNPELKDIAEDVKTIIE